MGTNHENKCLQSGTVIFTKFSAYKEEAKSVMKWANNYFSKKRNLA